MKKTIHLLLVEDNPGDARLIAETLRHQVQISIETVDRLASAVARMQRGGIDVVLLDLNLPDSQGIDTVRAITGKLPAMPVVVLTGHDDEATGLQAVRAGAQDYLAKGQLDGELLSRVLRFAVERQRIEAERIRLATAVEQAAEVFLITDTQGNIQYANPAFEKVTGYTCSEVYGQNPRLFKSGRQDQEFYRQLWQTITAGNTWHGRMVNKKKDGMLFTEEATISPVRDGAGTIVGYVAVKRDITHEIEMEMRLAQSQKMEAVGRLAGGVAHDFNNMLQVVMGNIEMVLMQATMPEKIQEKLEKAHNAAERATEVTQQLLAFARKQLIAPKVIDINDAISASLKLMRRLIGEDIELAWLPGARLSQIKFDPTQLCQIITNLCINARDAIAGVGKITIETKTAHIEEGSAVDGVDPGDYVLLVVGDTGCGMSKEVLEHLFEPFFTTKTVGHGTGLGLATIYGIVKQNNGFIRVASDIGKGTTFRIYFPSLDEPVTEKKDTAITQPPHGRGELVLLVDDETSLLALGKDMLENLGYRVMTAATPAEALHIAGLHANLIDLLITDVVMPEMNGRDLAQQIVGMNPRIKCLFMSGYTANVVAHRGVLEEDLSFLQKPFTLHVLAAKILTILSAR